MVCNSPELSLDLSPPIVKVSFPDLLTDFPITIVGDSSDLIKLIDFVNELEEEIKKIQAFQRELPLSFKLLNDAIGKFKEKVKGCEKRRMDNGKKIGESVGGVKLGNDVEKKDWLSSVQLWAQSHEAGVNGARSEGVTVSSFKEDEKAARLTLDTTPVVLEPSCRLGLPSAISPGSVDMSVRPQPRSVCQTSSRKQRRCWSPELHRRFVDALDKLGGPQAATPKQIRELMQVDGLTNDEVKSHLQKYRLHIRKLPTASTKAPTSIDHEMGGDTLELGYSNLDLQPSGSPEGPLHYVGSKKDNSSSMDEYEEEDSDEHSWKARQHM